QRRSRARRHESSRASAGDQGFLRRPVLPDSACGDSRAAWQRRSSNHDSPPASRYVSRLARLARTASPRSRLGPDPQRSALSETLRTEAVKTGNFLSELKRRNVYKAAVAYAVIAWLVIQATSILLPTFDAPGWAMKLVVGILVVGCPVILALSWAFEITPEGIKLESEIAPNESITRHTGRKIVGITIALAVIAAGLM